MIPSGSADPILSADNMGEDDVMASAATVSPTLEERRSCERKATLSYAPSEPHGEEEEGFF